MNRSSACIFKKGHSRVEWLASDGGFFLLSGHMSSLALAQQHERVHRANTSSVLSAATIRKTPQQRSCGILHAECLLNRDNGLLVALAFRSRSIQAGRAASAFTCLAIGFL